MNVDTLFSWLFSWQAGLWLLAIYCVIYTVRRFIETLVPMVKGQKLWADLALPVAPVLVGFGIGFIKSLPFPDGITSVGARVMFGVTMGFLSAKGYRIVVAFIKQRVPEALVGDSDDPV